MPRNQMLRRRLYRTTRPLLERLETRLVPANVDVLDGRVSGSIFHRNIPK